MNDLNIISQSLEFYDKNMENNKDILEEIHFIRIIKSTQFGYNNFNHIEFYDKDKKLIKKSRYEVLGLYGSHTKIWTWAWALPTLNKNSSHTAKKIFNYGYDIENNIFLKSELITSRFRVNNPIQLDIHLAIGAYLSKNNFIFSYKSYDPEFQKKNIVTHGDIQLLNVKNEYEKANFLEYYLIILD